MAAGDLTTLANLRAWLGVKDAVTSDDVVLEREITAVSSAIQSWLNRLIAQAAYTETLSGRGGFALSFANYPVSAVSAVSVDGVTLAPSSAVNVPGFVFSPTQLLLRGYSFSRGVQNVSFSYTAGYAVTPPELEQACIDWIAVKHKARDRIGHRSKSIGGETVTFLIADMPPDVKVVLQNWKKVVPT